MRRLCPWNKPGKTCETCRWWVKEKLFGEGNYIVCDLMTSHNGIPKSPTSLARSKDAECYISIVETDAHFSCNMYTPRFT